MVDDALVKASLDKFQGHTIFIVGKDQTGAEELSARRERPYITTQCNPVASATYDYCRSWLFRLDGGAREPRYYFVPECLQAEPVRRHSLVLYNIREAPTNGITLQRLAGVNQLSLPERIQSPFVSFRRPFAIQGLQAFRTIGAVDLRIDGADTMWYRDPAGDLEETRDFRFRAEETLYAAALYTGRNVYVDGRSLLLAENLDQIASSASISPYVSNRTGRWLNPPSRQQGRRTIQPLTHEAPVLRSVNHDSLILSMRDDLMSGKWR